MSARRAANVLAFDLLLLAFLVLGSRLATALHEAAGHAALAAALGAEVTSVEVSLFAGGRADFAFGGEPDLAVRFATSLGGILVNLLTGTLALAALPALQRRPTAALFLALFGSASLLGAFAYLTLGFYYGSGDPAEWAGPARATSLWVPFLAMAPVASYLAARAYATLQERWFPAAGLVKRFGWLAATLGLAGAVYGGLYYGFSLRRFTASEAREVAYERAVEEVRQARIEEMAPPPPVERTPPSQPPPQPPPPVVVEIRPEEVPMPFPIEIPLVALCLAGGLVGLARTKPGKPDEAVRVPLAPLAVAFPLACAVIGALAWLGERIYPL